MRASDETAAAEGEGGGRQPEGGAGHPLDVTGSENFNAKGGSEA
jgi:hypothetical protein